MNFLVLFLITNFINVLISTWKSIVTVNGSKVSAAFWNALGYAYYAWIVILTATGNIPTWQKVAVVFVCNIIGVYLVKWFEQKKRKDRLWKIELTVPTVNKNRMIDSLTTHEIPFNYIENIGKYTIFNVYAATQNETKIVDNLADIYNAKKFASETKLV